MQRDANSAEFYPVPIRSAMVGAIPMRGANARGANISRYGRDIVFNLKLLVKL